ncbi:MAG: C40 family peptidase [Gemmatimonadota bacterium]|nr:MAG: C40 family peptidase [Gemmatimonadota bacterium]
MNRCRTPSRSHVLALGLALSSTLGPNIARAQRALDIQAGSWSVSGSNPALYAGGVWSHLWGPSGYGFRGVAILADSSDASLYGLGVELSLLRGGQRFSPYIVGGLGLALRGGSSNEIVALWNGGLGIEWQPLSWLGLAAEASYLSEDGSFRGFWNLEDDDRRGWLLGVRGSLWWGARSSVRSGRPDDRSAARTPPANAGPEPPAGQEPGDQSPTLPYPANPGVGGGLPLAERVVDTALDAMGEPYRWGGTSTEEGFDCSGLVWYAYDAHGIKIPRTSREQGEIGTAVAADLAVLEAGDILLFSNRPGVVTHVGLYVGDGRFIHATTSGGVRVGRLDGNGDGNDRWYLDRWVGARRVLR